MVEPTVKERLSRVETEVSGMRGDVTEMKQDVKDLLAAHNRQKGAAKFASLVWAGLLGIGGLIGGIWVARPHT
jgi:hypothetical protein